MTALAVRTPFAAQWNWPRVGAWSGSISIHLFMIAVLLLPGAAIQIARHADVVPVIDIITPPAKPVPVLPTPAPLAAQPRVQRIAPPVATAVPHPSPLPVEAVRIAPPASDARPPAMAPTQTAPSAIAYGNRTHVAYPIEALRNREQGTVILRVLVGADGSVLGVEIEKTSGSRSLDRAAREAVAKWRFHPATRNGVALSAWASVPITFNLRSL